MWCQVISYLVLSWNFLWKDYLGYSRLGVAMVAITET